MSSGTAHGSLDTTNIWGFAHPRTAPAVDVCVLVRGQISGRSTEVAVGGDRPFPQERLGTHPLIIKYMQIYAFRVISRKFVIIPGTSSNILGRHAITDGIKNYLPYLCILFICLCFS